MIGYYHFILAHTTEGQKPLWGQQEIFGFAYHLGLKMYQVEINYLGSRQWINAHRSQLTFTKNGVPYYL
jgi:hypothetical protein